MARTPFNESHSGFAGRLSDMAMASLFANWVELRRAASGRLPDYRDFDPFRFAALMPNLQVFERTPDGRWRQRLVGETAADYIGANNKGRFLDEIVQAEHLAERVAHLNLAVDEGLPGASRGLLSRPSTEVDVFKRLLLPFAPDVVVSYIVFSRLRDTPGLPAGADRMQTVWATAADVA